jgi:nucleoside-diphosphate-sugar epimerase
MKYLVTGAAGFVGSAITSELISKGEDVVAIDAFLGGLYPIEEKLIRAQKLSSDLGVEVIGQNLNDGLVIDKDVDVVIHSAAMPGLAYSWENPDDYIWNNELATLNLVKSINQAQTPRFVFISTSSVYGKVAVGDERSVPQPVSPYGATKLAAEKMIGLVLSSETSFSIARLYSVYGPGQRSDMAYNRFIYSALRDEEITIFGDGSQSRSNTFIDDAVDGVLLTVEKGADRDIYNIGGGETVQLNSAVETIFDLANKEPKISYEQRIFGDQDITKANFSKATEFLGFEPKTSFANGIRKQFEWQISRF